MVNNYDQKSFTRSYAVTVRRDLVMLCALSAYKHQAFYQPNKHRTNFVVVVEALVHKILTEHEADETLNANGVAFICQGSPHVAKAGREVIVCAGSVETPYGRRGRR